MSTPPAQTHTQVEARTTFNDLSEDLQLLIVHAALKGFAPVCFVARRLRRVKKLFEERLVATKYQLRLCYEMLPLLRKAVDKPWRLVSLVTEIVLLLSDTPEMGTMQWTVPFEIYNVAYQTVYHTLHKASQSTQDFHRMFHMALREDARPRLSVALSHRPEVREWCIDKLTRMLAPCDTRSKRGDPRWTPHWAQITIKERMSHETPRVPTVDPE